MRETSSKHIRLKVLNPQLARIKGIRRKGGVKFIILFIAFGG